VQRYPLIRRRLSDPCRPHFSRFYVDFNSVIYNCLRVVFPRTPPEVLDLFSEICRYLDFLVRPQSVLFICVNGNPPFAKTPRQR
jgi:5'-3' exonuclease